MFSTLELKYLKAIKSKHYLHLSDATHDDKKVVCVGRNLKISSAMEDKVRRSIISKLNRWSNTEEPVISRILELTDGTWRFKE